MLFRKRPKQAVSCSAVIVSRNDNYGGQLKKRASYCLQSAIDTYDEVIYVDWNSPTQSLLHEIQDDLRLKGNLKHYVITPEKAALFVANDPRAQLCCEVLGRNIGIRRATSDWIVSTNIDIIAAPKPNLHRMLARASKKKFYTVSRRDVSWSTIHNIQGHDQLELGEYEGLREQLISLDLAHKPKGRAISEDVYSKICCCGDFQLASHNLWHTIQGFEERFIAARLADTNVQKKAWAYGYPIKAIFNLPIFHIDHGRGSGGIHTGQQPVVNSIEEAILEQQRSLNSDTWGFSDENILQEIL